MLQKFRWPIILIVAITFGALLSCTYQSDDTSDDSAISEPEAEPAKLIEPKQEPKHTRQALMTIHPNACVCSFTISEDLTQVAYVANTKTVSDGKQNYHCEGPAQVFVNGNAGDLFDQIVWTSMAFSQDGKHFAYWALKGVKWHVVRDGNVGEGFDAYQSSSIRIRSSLWPDLTRRTTVIPKVGGTPLIFSPDGLRLAYVARKGKKSIVMLDSVQVHKHDWISWGSLVFSPDSKRLGYVASDGDKYVAVAGEQIFGGFDSLDSNQFLFSTDNQLWAIVATREGKQFVLLNGEDGPKYSAVSELLFADKGHSFAYIGRRSDGSQEVVFNGAPMHRYDEIWGLKFIPNTDKVAFAARDGKRQFVYLAGKEFEPKAFEVGTYKLTKNTGPIVSPNGEHVAYLVNQEDRNYVVTDESVGKAYKDTSMPKWSPNSREITFSANPFVKNEDRQQQLAENASTTKEMDEGVLLVRNGVESKSFEFVLIFDYSCDSRHFIYKAKAFNENMWVFGVDDMEYLESELLVVHGGPRFFNKNIMRYLVFKNCTEETVHGGKKNRELNFSDCHVDIIEHIF